MLPPIPTHPHFSASHPGKFPSTLNVPLKSKSSPLTSSLPPKYIFQFKRIIAINTRNPSLSSAVTNKEQYQRLPQGSANPQVIPISGRPASSPPVHVANVVPVLAPRHPHLWTVFWGQEGSTVSSPVTHRLVGKWKGQCSVQKPCRICRD